MSKSKPRSSQPQFEHNTTSQRVEPSGKLCFSQMVSVPVAITDPNDKYHNQRSTGATLQIGSRRDERVNAEEIVQQYLQVRL